MDNRVLLIGCGKIGVEYCKVLKALKQVPVAIGRGEKNASIFEEKTGVHAIMGGVDEALSRLEVIPDYAIVAVDVINLEQVTISLLKAGVKTILVEKPAGMSREEIAGLSQMTDARNANVYVAYNRRFFASTENAIRIINNDGGVLSTHFEFTEWGQQISELKAPAELKEIALLSNSSHVIDLAFFMAGHPVEMSSYIDGSLPWHHNGSRYAGAGYTEKGALFSYCANWESPGRWSVEIMTSKHRLIFRPMEKLAIQELNSIKIDFVDIDDRYDTEYKPGFYKQVEAFLFNHEDKRLLTIASHLDNLRWYEKIAGVDRES